MSLLSLCALLLGCSSPALADIARIARRPVAPRAHPAWDTTIPTYTPGEPVFATGSPTGDPYPQYTSASSSSGSSSSSSSSSSTGDDSSSSTSGASTTTHHGLSATSIAAIAIVLGVALVASIAAIMIFRHRRRMRERALYNKDYPSSNASRDWPGSGGPAGPPMAAAAGARSPVVMARHPSINSRTSIPAVSPISSTHANVNANANPSRRPSTHSALSPVQTRSSILTPTDSHPYTTPMTPVSPVHQHLDAQDPFADPLDEGIHTLPQYNLGVGQLSEKQAGVQVAHTPVPAHMTAAYARNLERNAQLPVADGIRGNGAFTPGLPPPPAYDGEGAGAR